MVGVGSSESFSVLFDVDHGSKDVIGFLAAIGSVLN